MRKFNQKVTDQNTILEILQAEKICRVAMIDDNAPYLLAFNYGYHNNALYIHCAREGRKVNVLKKNPKVCFEIENSVAIIPSEHACSWSTMYRSVVGMAMVEILENASQIEDGLQIIMKQHGATEKQIFDEKHLSSVYILKLAIVSLSAKKSSNYDKIKSSQQLNFSSERVSFSEVEINDVSDIHRLHSSKLVDEYNTIGIPEGIEQTESFVKNVVDDRFAYPRKFYTWKMCRTEDNMFIGLAGLSLSLDKFRLGEIYFKLLPEIWGKGLGTEIARQLIHIGFDKFGLHKVEAGVATENVRSVNVLEKAGMKREGLRRKILPIRGAWHDNYHYAIVETDQR